MDQEPLQPSDLEAIYGGRTVAVTTNKGETVELFVRIVPIRLGEKLMGLFIEKNLQEAVEFVLEVKENWCD